MSMQSAFDRAQQIKRLEHDLAEVLDEYSVLEKELIQVRSQLGHAESEIAELRTARDTSEAALAALRAEKSKPVRHNLDDNVEIIHRLEAQLKESQSANLSLLSQLAKAQQAAATTESLRSAFTALHEDFERLAASAPAVDTIKSLEAALGRATEEQKRTVATAAKQHAASTAEIASLRAEIESLHTASAHAASARAAASASHAICLVDPLSSARHGDVSDTSRHVAVPNTPVSVNAVPSQDVDATLQQNAELARTMDILATELGAVERQVEEMRATHAAELSAARSAAERERQSFEQERAEVDGVVFRMTSELEALLRENNELRLAVSQRR